MGTDKHQVDLWIVCHRYNLPQKGNPSAARAARDRFSHWSQDNSHNGQLMSRHRLKVAQREFYSTGVLFTTGQLGRMNNGVEGFRSQLQKELGLSIGPKDPLLALVGIAKGAPSKCRQTAKIAERVPSCTWQESNRLVRAGESDRTAEFKRRATGSSK
jgi:hypothetical protein